MRIARPPHDITYKSSAWLAICAATLSWPALVGCSRGGPTAYPASGRVVFSDNSPLTSGNIEFAPVDGEIRTSARGMIEKDGSFRLSTFSEADGALPGRHRVLIIPGRQRGESPGTQKRTLHGKYESFDTSGLEATISEDGPNNFEFVVEPAT